MKKTTIAIILVICLVSVAFITGAAEDTEESTLTVSATESVSAQPDIAYVYLGVNTRGVGAKEAQEKNTELSNSFIEAVKALGVDDKDIETSNLSIYQDYENSDVIIMDLTYKVTIRDIDSAGAIIDAAVEAGMNSTYSLSFDIEDRDSLYNEALGKAMQAVAAKAADMAEMGGYTIVRPKSIVEGGSSSYYEQTYQMEAMPAADMETGGASGGTSLSPGEIEVSAYVTGTYVIQ